MVRLSNEKENCKRTCQISIPSVKKAQAGTWRVILAINEQGDKHNDTDIEDSEHDESGRYVKETREVTRVVVDAAKTPQTYLDVETNQPEECNDRCPVLPYSYSGGAVFAEIDDYRWQEKATLTCKVPVEYLSCEFAGPRG